MQFDLPKSIQILERTPHVIKILLENLPSGWTQENEGENTWSSYDIVGHLIHGEKTDWVTRAEIILSNREVKAFEAYDRFAQFENSKGKSLKELLDEFGKLRSQNLQKLNSFKISDEHLSLEGVHPAFKEVTLRQLLSA